MEKMVRYVEQSYTRNWFEYLSLKKLEFDNKDVEIYIMELEPSGAGLMVLFKRKTEDFYLYQGSPHFFEEWKVSPDKLLKDFIKFILRGNKVWKLEHK